MKRAHPHPAPFGGIPAGLFWDAVPFRVATIKTDPIIPWRCGVNALGDEISWKAAEDNDSSDHTLLSLCTQTNYLKQWKMTMHGPHIVLYFLPKTGTFHWYVVRLAEENEICRGPVLLFFCHTGWSGCLFWRSAAGAPVELIESNQHGIAFYNPNQLVMDHPWPVHIMEFGRFWLNSSNVTPAKTPEQVL